MDKCQTIPTVRLTGKKWTFAIMQEVFLNGGQGFNEMQKRIKKISPKLLAKRLKDLENIGLIEKKVSDKIPAKSSYFLTKKGKELHDILVKFKDWNQRFSISLGNCRNTSCLDCPLYSE